MKYATVDDAEGAIKALNGQYTFAGVSASVSRKKCMKPLVAFGQPYIYVFAFFQELAPVVVKYADSERERLGNCSTCNDFLFVPLLSIMAFLHTIQVLLWHLMPCKDFRFILLDLLPHTIWICYKNQLHRHSIVYFVFDKLEGRVMKMTMCQMICKQYLLRHAH